jgi:hypothetical protein
MARAPIVWHNEGHRAPRGWNDIRSDQVTGWQYRAISTAPYRRGNSDSKTRSEVIPSALKKTTDKRARRPSTGCRRPVTTPS